MDLDELLDQVEGLMDEDEAEDVEGDADEFDEVGRRRSRSRRRRRRVAKNLIIRARRSEGRDALVGIGVRTSIGIAGTVSFAQNATRGMQLTDLFIQGEVSERDLSITSFRISDVDQLLSGEAGATMFNDAGRVSRRQNWEPLSSGTPMTVILRNDNAAAQDVTVHALARVNR